ncbi:MAG: hypothetical protein ABII12_14320 [Planctomycetota bacterium]
MKTNTKNIWLRMYTGVALVSAVAAATSARGEVPYEIGCDGGECGGSGATLCGYRDYAYPVADVDGRLTDVYIGTDDPHVADYADVCAPGGWTFAIESAGFGNHEPGKTDHGLFSTYTGNDGHWVIHFSDDTPGDGVLGTGLPGAFTFGFNHTRPSHDVGWQATGSNGSAEEDWTYPVGLGVGPVHGPAWPAVFCDGAESGGEGTHDYEYLVEDHDLSLTDLYIGTDDPNAANYTNISMPPDWSLAIEADPFPIDHDPQKTAHGSDSPNPGLNLDLVIHFTGPAGLPDGKFRFGFDHPWPSHDVGWRAVDNGGEETAEDWSFPVGMGAGPVHAPYDPPRIVCDGAESSGTGTVSCDANPRDYAYLATDPHGELSDVYISTFDQSDDEYESICVPPGWSFAIEADPFPIEYGSRKTPHGGTVSCTPCSDGRSVIHFSGPPGLPNRAFAFGFNCARPSKDAGWRAVGHVLTMQEDWSESVGLGVGPIHSPARQSGECGCPGDIDGSGVVDLDDLCGFVGVLLSAPDDPCGDIDLFALANGLDIQPFVDLILANDGAGTSCEPCACDADLTGDGLCDPNDIPGLIACMGDPTPPGCEQADLNCDGKVDDADVDSLTCQMQYGCQHPSCCP